MDWLGVDLVVIVFCVMLFVWGKDVWCVLCGVMFELLLEKCGCVIVLYLLVGLVCRMVDEG